MKHKKTGDFKLVTLFALQTIFPVVILLVFGACTSGTSRATKSVLSSIPSNAESDRSPLSKSPVVTLIGSWKIPSTSSSFTFHPNGDIDFTTPTGSCVSPSGNKSLSRGFLLMDDGLRKGTAFWKFQGTASGGVLTFQCDDRTQNSISGGHFNVKFVNDKKIVMEMNGVTVIAFKN